MTDKELARTLRAAYTGWNNPPSRGLPEGAGCLLEAADALEAKDARIADLEAALTKANRTASDNFYMREAYRSMLGTKGLAVVAMWEANGVKRVHHSWGPDAEALTGEERAQLLIDWESAPKQVVDSIDGDDFPSSRHAASARGRE